jgi:AraC family transcriptional regulator
MSANPLGISSRSCVATDTPTSGKRIEELIEGRLRSAEPTLPLISSAQSPWTGFLLERSVCYDGAATTIIFPYTELLEVLAGSICVKYRAMDADAHFVAGEGTVTLWPAGHELTDVLWMAERVEGSTQVLRIQLDMSALEPLAPEDDPIAGVRLAPQFAVEDSTLTSLMRLMELDVAAGCPAGKLYAKSLSLALAAHVATRYSIGSLGTVSHAGLPHPVLTRVLDYICANLGRDLTITELAAVANMSAHHFSLRFKRSVGVAPHQWVVRARVREAQRLLRSRSMSVAEVALALGFASQTHFTDVFHRVTGTTPRHYQRLS